MGSGTRKRYIEELLASWEYHELSPETVDRITGKCVYLLDTNDESFPAIKIVRVDKGVFVVGQALDSYGYPIEDDLVRAPYWAVFEWTPDEYFNLINIPVEDCVDYDHKFGRRYSDPGKKPKRVHAAVLRSWEGSLNDHSDLVTLEKIGSKLVLVNSPQEIAECVYTFRQTLQKSPEWATALMRTITYWIYDPQSNAFAPNKWSGYKGMDFAR